MAKVSHTKLTAKDLQWIARVHAMQHNHEWITPNVQLYAWESDLLSVTTSNLVHEFEVKLTKHDLLRDLRKPKHANEQLVTGRYTRKPPGQTHNSAETRELLNMEKGGTMRRPNYFWFVAPENVIARINIWQDLPPYAGVLSVSVAVQEYDGLPRIVGSVERKADRLHTDPLLHGDLLTLARRMHHKYWNEMANDRMAERQKLIAQLHKEPQLATAP